MMIFLFRNGNKRVITQIKPPFVNLVEAATRRGAACLIWHATEQLFDFYRSMPLVWPAGCVKSLQCCG
ncbi:hypothetical protein ACFPAG_11675 [Vogesella sp. GCM10023246]|uniref:Uncharacterized protein n=1 Tax=Vogesella oryzagri TaxID=3160864 RepID=A0ABV1M7C3_9NEIS